MIRLAITGIILASLGCATQPSTDPDRVPDPLEVSLKMWTKDGRATYMTVDRNGELSFAGGRSALSGVAQRAGLLTDEQRRAVWATVRRYGLLDAEGDWFREGETVTYELQLRAGAQSRSIRAADDAVPGIGKLNDQLFGYQAQMRYGQVIRPIELEIERRANDGRLR